MLLGLTGQRPILPSSVRTGRRSRPRPRRAIHRPQLAFVFGWPRQRLDEQAPQRGYPQRTIRQGIARARPTAAEAWAQTMADECGRSDGRQHGIHQLKQAILAMVQVVVQLLAEVAERRQSMRFRHTPSLTPFPLYRKSPRQPGPSFESGRDGSHLAAPRSEPRRALLTHRAPQNRSVTRQ